MKKVKRFCTHCGKPRDDELQFCTYCGKAYAENQPLNRPPRKKKAMGIGVIVFLVIVAHISIQKSIDPADKFEAMTDAIHKEDVYAFFDHVNLEDGVLINEEDYFQFIQEGDWDFISAQLEEVTSSEKAGDDILIKGRDNRKVFQVEEKAWLFGLYKTYKVEGIIQEIIASTTRVPMTVTINGDPLIEMKEADKEMEIAQAYPGVYRIEGYGEENEFGDIRHEEEVNVFPMMGHSRKIYVNFPLETYNLNSNNMDTALFYNENSRNKKWSDFEKIGSFPEAEDAFLDAEWRDENGKILRTEEVSLEPALPGPLSFMFELETSLAEEAPVEDAIDEQMMNIYEIPKEELLPQIEEFVLKFRDDYEQALNEDDFSIAARYLEQGSDAAIDLEKYIGDVAGNGFIFDFHENFVEGAEKISQEFFEVQTKEKFTFTDADGVQTHYERYKVYTVYFSSHGFKIVDIKINDTKREKV
ncbi:Uncharacterized membrane protein YvbJ [Halobacillus karajensis]|uniref:TcaA NTF2-like domain-containing protein n=1 Tax=Halobacillus karajensis TaxID=195088 RepID=UPI0008A7644F|nr:hypothetical protein [Halobacillus karajensis]SEH41011.1 Uncharacterized membrane protein YvbJ [Halobacillus karajensis]